MLFPILKVGVHIVYFKTQCLSHEIKYLSLDSLKDMKQ